jgi:hypothetical protein
MDINPKQIKCAYWTITDLENQDFEVVECGTTGNGTITADGLTYFWLLIILVNNDITKKVFIDEDGVPFIFIEFN